jgi:hypothetical protein
MEYSFEVTPRAASLGGGYNLRLFENGEEVGGGVFPLAAYADDPDTSEISACADAHTEGQAWLAAHA